ncbi:VOC family protein [Luteolibacter sp. GHJ8]|uniref:VOC family protein n=1 Tax=Luteolibacter rhizosphaerae TaxID=2989719 RepID=A0ABT3G342_9BACT|nr:VOC family protein [Luteolibacter rhizosphaerae]MCW1914253.1 VOC family protein [Luteolibacter rhizosphaerae]
MSLRSKISPCLWFDGQAEPAARFYTSVFKNSKIENISYYSDVGKEHHGQESGTVMAVGFQIEGQTFTALNGGPIFKISEAISFQIDCETQEEVDYYWDKLNEGGDPSCQACGWLKDQFGVSWQVVPAALLEMMLDPDAAKVRRVTATMMEMKKLDIAALKAAYDG